MPSQSNGKPVPVPTKYIVLKNNQNTVSTTSSSAPVVTKVIRPPLRVSTNPATNGAIVTPCKVELQNLNTTASGSNNSTSSGVSRNAYERHGTEEFLKRIQKGATHKMKVTYGSQVSDAVSSNQDSSCGNNKKVSPPKQINIFSALDDEFVASKKKETVKKSNPARVELSCTYQPPSKPTPKSTSPLSATSRQQTQTVFDKFAGKDDWLLEFSGSPTKSPSKPGGSTVDISDYSSDEGGERKTSKCQTIAAGHRSKSIEVVNLDSSTEETHNGKNSKQQPSVDDVDFEEEEEDAVGSRKTRSVSKDEKERELSFVEARSRRKRKPPTYFGYEDHELSYNLGLNPVFTPEELEAAAKKKKQSGDNSSTASSASSKRKVTSKAKKAPKRVNNKRSNSFSGSEVDEESSDDERSLSRSVRALKSTEKTEDLSEDSSDEEPLTAVVQKEKSKDETIVTDKADASRKSESPQACDELSKSADEDEIEQTAYRLFYKENSDRIQRKLSSDDVLSEKVSDAWCKLGSAERGVYEKQARELTKITLPPQLQKNKSLKDQTKTSKPVSEPVVSLKSNNFSQLSNSFSSKSTRKDITDNLGVLSKLAADLNRSDTSSEEDTSDLSPVRPVSKKSRLKRVNISSSSEEDSSDGGSSSEEEKLRRRKLRRELKGSSRSGVKKEEGKPPKQEAVVVATPKICFNCPKEAVKSTLWCSDGQYCSISCCVLYSKKCFNDWVAERKRKAQLKKEQNEIEALKHAKDFFCIETEDDSETQTTCKNGTPPFSPNSVKLE